MKRVWWLPALLVVAAGTALWHGATSKEPPQVAEAAQAAARPVAEAEREPSAPRPGKTELLSAPIEPQAAALLRELCGQPWVADFTQECLEALERRYGESAVADASSRYGFRPSLLGERVTWHQVLEKPA